MIKGMKRVTSGTEYEKWCASYLSRHGFHQIELTKATGDQGIDIIAFRRHCKYGIQCKFYDSPVGNSSVQEAYTGAAFYGCDKAVVMTNNIFTRSARQLADETAVLLWPQKDPQTEDRYHQIYRSLRLLELSAGILLFLSVLFQPQMPSREYFSLGALLWCSGALFGLFSYQSLTMNLLTDLMDFSMMALIFVLQSLNGIPLSYPYWLPNTLLLLISLFQLIGLIKTRSASQYEKEQKLLEENIQAQMQALGEETGRVLEAELHCHLELLASRKDGSVLVFQYHADKMIADSLAAAEFSMNQYAAHDGLSDTYQILDMGRRKLQVSIHRTNQ